MHNYTDMIMTEDESAEIEIAIENWSTCDLGIILLMTAVVVATLYNFFFTIGWIQFIERNIIIVPAIIGLIIQSSLHFKRSALKLATATSYIVKRMALNNVATTNSAVQRMAMTIISFTVESYSTSVAAIMYVVKEPTIAYYTFATLVAMDVYHLTYFPRTIRAAYLSLTILTGLLNHNKLVRKNLVILLASFIIAKCSLTGIWYCGLIMLSGHDLFFLISSTDIYVMIFCFSFSHDLNSNKLVYFVVALSITTFTYDLVLSCVEIPDTVDVLLYYLSLYVPSVYFLVNFCIACHSSIITV